MNNISFVIFTHNEEKRVAHVIKNFIRFGEVLIFDDASNDNTRGVAEALGAKFITRPGKIQPDSHEMYDFVKQHVRNDWIFWGCADHILPLELLEKMCQISSQSQYKYVYIPIYTYLWGEIDHPAHKGYNPRFFKKDYLSFAGNSFHGLGKFTGHPEETLTLPMREKYAIHHYSLYDLRKFTTKHLDYSDIEAEQKLQVGKKFSILLMLAAMLRYFFIFYRYSFKNGTKGLIAAMSYSFFRFMVYVKLYELENKLTLESIESNYIIGKEKILKDIK